MYTDSWMIYGANGYTGTLIASEARRLGLTPILAGRSAGKLVALAARLGLEHRVFDLDNPRRVQQKIAGCRVLLNCAGPFSATAERLVEACLAASLHYLDVSGEIDVFEYVQQRSEDARHSGVVLCSGVGFDVIPTDCMAAQLAGTMPDATHLALGFDSDMHMSAGTAKTSFEGLAKGGRVRRDGRLERVPLAWRTREIDFGRGPRLGVTIPWGDVATAWYTTGIPNIEVFVAASEKLVKRLRRANTLRPLLGLGPVQRFVKRRIGRRVRGPDASQRSASSTWVWGEARNENGDIRTGRIVTANGYDVTIRGALAVVDKLMRGAAPSGSTTPALLMGRQFVTRLPGCGEFEIQ